MSPTPTGLTPVESAHIHIHPDPFPQGEKSSLPLKGRRIDRPALPAAPACHAKLQAGLADWRVKAGRSGPHLGDLGIDRSQAVFHHPVRLEHCKQIVVDRFLGECILLGSFRANFVISQVE